jgi:DNA mismatch repair protein MutL
MNKIKLLSNDITNTIDSNKIITKIAVVVKELLENSIDANARNINILIKDGGIGLIELRDDGDGIDKDDFEKLCSRFNSSKCGDKMEMLSTLGFRGEALAILSYIAGLVITSRTKQSQCGYEAVFKDGKMVPTSFKLVTCDYGTTIKVSNLFSNNVVRKNYYDKSDETKEVINLIQKYAFHFYFISFTLANNLPSDVILKTRPLDGNDLLTTFKHLSARLYTQEISDNLFYFNNNANNDNLIGGITYDCIFTKPSANIDKSQLILFINNRLVQNNSIKKLIDQTYSKYLIKNGNYFVYLNIKCKPDIIDVNVRGNKSEVYIENEQILIAQIKLLLEEHLNKEITSKNYYVGNYTDLKRKEDNVFNPRDDLVEYIYAKDKVRVDTKNVSIERYLNKAGNKACEEKLAEEINFDDCLGCIYNELFSQENINENLTNILKDCFYIGYESDNQLAFIQNNTSLYIINIRTLIQEYLLYLILENKAKKCIEKLKINSQYSYKDLITFFKANINPNLNECNFIELLRDKLHILGRINIFMTEEYNIKEIFFINLGIDNNFKRNFLNNLPLFCYSLMEYLNLEKSRNKNLAESENLNFIIEVCKMYSFYLTNIYIQYLSSSEHVANAFLNSLFTDIKSSLFFVRKNVKESYLIEKIVDTETLYTVFERC